jgi:outer membrane biosynthesis protein TonB
MQYDAYGRPIKSAGSGLTPLLVLLVLGSGAGNYWLWQDRQKMAAASNAAIAKTALAEAVAKQLSERIDKLEADKGALVAANEKLTKEVAAAKPPEPPPQPQPETKAAEKEETPKEETAKSEPKAKKKAPKAPAPKVKKQAERPSKPSAEREL